jgi:cation transport regulator ChaB
MQQRRRLSLTLARWRWQPGTTPIARRAERSQAACEWLATSPARVEMFAGERTQRRRAWRRWRGHLVRRGVSRSLRGLTFRERRLRDGRGMLRRWHRAWQAASRLDALLAAAQSKSASRVSTQAKPPDVPLRVVASQATALRAWEAPDDELVESELPLARREQLQEQASRVQLCAALTREAAAQYSDEEQRRERERQDRQAVKLQEEQARKRAHVSSHREARLAAELGLAVRLEDHTALTQEEIDGGATPRR